MVSGAAFLLSLNFLGPAVLAIARGYTTSDTGLQTGMVVTLNAQSSDTSKVERATQDNNQRVVGVVTTIDDSLVTVASGTTKVLVESEGEVNAYVADLNGEVKKGDLLVISPLKGILMKSDSSPTTIIGIAASDFSAGKADDYTIQDGTATKTAHIAKLKVNLNRQGSTNVNLSQVDSSLSRLGKAIVGKDVGEIRVVIAMVIFFIVLIAEGGILYGAISSAITALGRNPLARKIIRKELIRVVLIAIVVLFIGLGAIFGILWV